MRISSQFPTSLDAPQQVAIAERLGYDSAWLFDTPHQSPDVWMMLALAAQRTEHIRLGPGVLVPTLRHPMVNASGAAALSALAPGRVAVAFGTGFAGARAMGAKPSTWAYLRDYVRVFRGLLRGETVDWDGGRMRMLHPAGHAPARPIDLPVLISALGPKGLAAAKELADGLFTVNGQTQYAKEFTWAALGVHGTVLAEGEALDSPRVRETAGPGNALAYHAAYEFGGDVTTLPAGQAWLDAVNQAPEGERHLAIFDQHLVALSDADQVAWAAGSWAAIPTTTVTGSAAQLTERLAGYAEQGITEILYQPTGPDIAGELDAFLAAARAVPTGLSCREPPTSSQHGDRAAAGSVRPRALAGRDAHHGQWRRFHPFRGPGGNPSWASPRPGSPKARQTTGTRAQLRPWVCSGAGGLLPRRPARSPRPQPGSPWERPSPGKETT